MKELIYVELKKTFQIKKILILSLILAAMISSLLLSNQSNEKRSIEIYAQNILTTSRMFLNGQDDLQNRIEEYSLDEIMSYEEINDLYDKLTQNIMNQYDAIMNYDFELYNQYVNDYYENDSFALLYGMNKEEWGKVKDNNSKCEGEIICLTSGNAPFHNDEMAAYNLENHVYISEYKMSDDYLYQFLSSYSVIIVPLIGIFVTYLILNQEKKEDSAKYMWALPYSKIKIFISKTISAFLYAFVVYLLILFIIFVVVGSIKGFSFGQRLITLYANSLFLIKADYAHQYVVMTQGQYNLLLILVNLFTLFISVLLSEFLSLILKNKKLVFVLSLLIVMLPFGIGEILIKTLNHKYLFMLYPFYFIYTMIPYYAKWFIINQRYFAIEVGGSYVTLSNISMNNHLYVKDMNLCLGLFVGIITIFMIILLASFILKRKDLI